MEPNRPDKHLATKLVEADPNRDPLSGAPGAHPVGVGTGATAGGVAGAVVGAAVAGPIGALAGAVVGAVAGGYAGKGVAETLDPTVEHSYWRQEYAKRPYFAAGSDYEQYGPAYQYGWESYSQRAADARTFDQVEADLQRDWDGRRGASKLNWDQAKLAARDAWQRREKASTRPRA